MVSRLRRFLIAMAILPLIGGVALASGPAMFVCRGDQVAREICCCPAHDQRLPATSPTGTTVSPACCCDRSQANVPAAPAAEPRISLAGIDHLVPTPMAGVADVSFPPSVRVWTVFELSQGPPPAIPILLSKQSFLI